MHRGYFAIWRKFQDHPFWKEKREFSKAEAWIDLLWEAQHDENPRDVIIGMTVFKCNYGESLKSIETWAKRWGWCKSRVDRFLKLLKKLQQIDTKTERITTRITILNYSIYDPRRNASETTAERKRNASETTAERERSTDNNDKNVKNENNDKNIVESTSPKKPKNEKKFDPKKACPEFMQQKDWDDFLFHRKKRRKEDETERTLKRLITEFTLAHEAGEDLSTLVDIYADKKWISFEYQWIVNEREQKGARNGKPEKRNGFIEPKPGRTEKDWLS